jgi:hypothetical protein
MKKSISLVIALSVILVTTIATFQTGNAIASVKYDYTRTTITLNETVEFSAEVSSFSNMTWFCDDVAVQSELGMSSNYTFIPKALGTYLIKLSVDGFTNPPPMGPTKVTVIAEPKPSPTPIQSPSETSTPTQSSTPIVPEFPSIIIILTFLITVTLLLTNLVKRKKLSSF